MKKTKLIIILMLLITTFVTTQNLEVSAKNIQTIRRLNSTYNVDKIQPSISYSPNSSSWTNKNVTVAIKVTDTGGSGLSKWRYRYSSNGGKTWGTWSNWRTSNYNFTFTSQGTRRLQVEAIDKAGNKKTLNSGNYLIDKTKPTMSMIKNSSNGFCTTGSITLSTTISDKGGSGLNKLQYSYNQSTWHNSGTQPTAGASSYRWASGWSTKAARNIYFRTIDRAGNISNSKGTWTNIASSCNNLYPISCKYSYGSTWAGTVSDGQSFSSGVKIGCYYFTYGTLSFLSTGLGSTTSTIMDPYSYPTPDLGWPRSCATITGNGLVQIKHIVPGVFEEKLTIRVGTWN